MRCWSTALLLAALVPALHAGIEWQATTLTIDAEPLDEEAVGVFAFTNTGDSAITLTDVSSSCGCTVPELTKKVYAPGESGELRAVFTFQGREGKQVKTISVRTDDKARPYHELTLVVNIPRLFEAEPRFVVWRQGQEPVPKTIAIRVLRPDVVTLTALDSPDSRFMAKLERQEDEPGTYQVTITPRNTDEATQATVTVLTDLPPDSNRVITLYALIR